MNKYFAYTRVSTPRQGEKGVSLEAQSDAITRHARARGLDIIEWHEERKTAAKRGRPVFARMLKLLRGGTANGVIVHKIDRSARNLKDWAELGELVDGGIDVHFANESLDLHSRGGRLSADIQAVVAADYIRNLREEAIKGLYGRVKQGLYPWGAPLGYENRGSGKPKTIDPVKGPLVRQAFELYASGCYNLDDLVVEMQRRGLRNSRGGKVTRNGLSTMFNNPFYIGLIRTRTKETFPGAHEPLIAKRIYERVRAVLDGKTNARAVRHEFPFRRFLVCKHCGYSLIGELQKGRSYYRCHSKGCPTTSVREDAIHKAALTTLGPLQFTHREELVLDECLTAARERYEQDRQSAEATSKLRLARIQQRLDKLVDVLIDGVLDKALFESRKTKLLLEQRDQQDRLVAVQRSAGLPEEVAAHLELAKRACSSYESGFDTERREILEAVTSNRTVSGRNLELMLASPFRELAEHRDPPRCRDVRDGPRTMEGLVAWLARWTLRNPDKVQNSAIKPS